MGVHVEVLAPRFNGRFSRSQCLAFCGGKAVQGDVLPKLEPQDALEAGQIRRVQQGDVEAFSALVERYQRRVFSVVYRLVRRKEDAEDLVQEVFFKAFRAIRSYHFQSSLGTWLARIAVNHCYDYLRKLRKTPITYFADFPQDTAIEIESRPSAANGAAEDQGHDLILRDWVGKLLDRAPVDDRVVLTLKEMEDYSVEEIGEILKLNRNTVKVRLHRARKRMLRDAGRWRQEG